MPSGGLQKPASPAPQSGPGALSQRTDGGAAQVMRDLPNAKYGENSAFRDIESGAPMAAAPSGGGGGSARGAGSPPPQPSMDPPPPLTGGSLNPDEPVTAGASLGPGPNGMMLPAPPQEADTALSVVQRAAMNGGAQAAALLARIQTGL